MLAGLVLVFTGTVLGSRAGWAGADALAQVMADVRRTTRLIDGRTSVLQIYHARAFGRDWRFTARITKETNRILVQSPDAPRFLPNEMQLELVQVADLLEGYDLRLAGQSLSPSGTPVWVVEGQRPAGGKGARFVRFWVERPTGLVTHLELAYWWGRLTIDQTYQRVGPHTVLDQQAVRIDPLGIRVQVLYREYDFEGR